MTNSLAIGMGLCMGLAVLGAGIGQGKVAAAALEGISRNPGSSGKTLVPLILGLAFIESIVLFAFVVANNLDAHF